MNLPRPEKEKNKNKRIVGKALVAVVSILLTASLLPACGKSESEGSGIGQEKHATAKKGEKEFKRGIELFEKGVQVFKESRKALSESQVRTSSGYYSDSEKVSLFTELSKQSAELFMAAGEEFSKAAKEGNVVAVYYMGMCLDYGDVQAGTAGGALEFYKEAADQGLAEAQNMLGKCYFFNKGASNRQMLYPLVDNPAERKAEGIEWWKKAAAQGDAESQYYLGLAYSNLDGVQESSSKDVFNYFKSSAEQGYAPSQYNLGLMYLNKGWGPPRDAKEAAKWFKKAADQGYAPAKVKLGECYYSGDGVTKDPKKAVELFHEVDDESQKGIDRNTIEARYALAVCYLEGAGVKQDKEKAIQMLRPVANCTWYSPEAFKIFKNQPTSPCTKAKYRLGLCYADGDGIGKDAGEASHFLSAAAGSSDADEQMLLTVAERFETGNGVSQDDVKALSYYSHAAIRNGGLRKDENGKWKGGNVHALYKTGQMLLKLGNTAEALKYFRQAADQGDKDALAALKELGDLDKAAESGDAKAQ